MADLEHRLARGEYRVDAKAVADAIIRRIRVAAQERAPRSGGARSNVQNECS